MNKSLKDFYPTELTTESHNDEAAVVEMTAEEFTTEAETQLESIERDLSDIDRAEVAITSLGATTDLAAKALTAESIDDITISAVNMSFESIVAGIDYPVAPSIDLEAAKADGEKTVEELKDRAKEVSVNVYNAIKAMIVKVGDMAVKVVTWVKSKMGLYKKTFEELENSVKKLGKVKEDTITMGSIPGAMSFYSMASGTSLKDSDKLGSAFVSSYLDDTLDHATSVLDATKESDDKAVQVLADAGNAYGKRSVIDGMEIVAIRPSRVIGMSGKDLKDLKIETVSIDSIKDIDKGVKAITVDGKVQLETASSNVITSYIDTAKKAFDLYSKGSSDFMKRIKDAKKDLKDAKSDDKEGTKAILAMIKMQLKVLPATTMMYIDVTDQAVKFAKASIANYETAK